MKRMYLGIGLLAVLLAAGILVTVLFTACHDPIRASLEQAAAAARAGDWERASALTERAESAWKRSRCFTAAVADHAPMEEMEAMFARLRQLAQLRQSDEFTADCAQLASMAAAMVESQRISWQNLL